MLSYNCFFIEINILNVFRLRFSDHNSVFCLEKVIVNGQKQRVVVNDRKKKRSFIKTIVRKKLLFHFFFVVFKTKRSFLKKVKMIHL